MNYFSCVKIDFSSNPRPPNWQITAWQLDPNNTDNNGYQNEDFIVWMRTAAMPTFRKLYRKLNSPSTGTFQNGLPAGNYTLSITYSIYFTLRFFLRIFVFFLCLLKIIQ